MRKLVSGVLSSLGFSPAPEGAAHSAYEAAEAAAVGFVRYQEPPKEWVAALRRVAPVADRSADIQHSHLELVWWPGEWWVPIQRWSLWQMVNPALIDPAIREELDGPHPRSEGHFCTADERLPNQFRCLCRRKLETWRDGPCHLITLEQWDLYRRTGYYGEPWWVIEGDQGGHLFQFSEQEQQMLAAKGLPTEPVPITSLPGAPFDGRVLQHVQRHNRLVALDMELQEYQRRHGRDNLAEQKRAQREFREQLVQLLMNGMDELDEAVKEANNAGEFDHLPTSRKDVDYDRLMPQTIEHFVETGNLLHHSKAK